MDKENEKKESFGRFLEEFAKLDLTPELACCTVYGEWSAINFKSGFEAKDYLKYSPEARKEVVLAAFQVENDAEPWTWSLRNTCSGLVCTGIDKEDSSFFKELDLWKEWGVSTEFINKAIKMSIDAKISTRKIKNFEVFKALVGYAHVTLAVEEAEIWLKYLSDTEGLNPGYNSFASSIRKRIAH